MNTITTIAFPVKTEDEQKARKEVEKLGFSLDNLLSSFVSGLSNHTVRNDTMKLQIEVPSEYFKETIDQARKNRKLRKSSPVFDNAEEHEKWLESQGI